MNCKLLQFPRLSTLSLQSLVNASLASKKELWMAINDSKFTLKLRWPTNSPLFFPSSFVYFNFSSKLRPNKLKQMQLTMKERSVPEYFLMKADRARESPKTVADFSIFAWSSTPHSQNCILMILNGWWFWIDYADSNKLGVLVALMMISYKFSDGVVFRRVLIESRT